PGDLVTSLRAQAGVQLELGQEQEALHIYERCVQLLQELPALGAPEQLAAIYHGQGRLHEQQEHYAQALEAYQQALQVLDAEREPQGYAVVLHDIGDVYRAQQDLEQALSYYQQAAAFKERRGQHSFPTRRSSDLAAVQLELGQEQEALHVCQRSLDL